MLRSLAESTYFTTSTTSEVEGAAAPCTGSILVDSKLGSLRLQPHAAADCRRPLWSS